nr:transposase [Bradyrhizobium sp. CCBAU 11386]
MAEFYAIEKDIRARSAEERRLVRQQKSQLLADAFQKWLHPTRRDRPEGQARDGILYALSRLGADALHR